MMKNQKKLLSVLSVLIPGLIWSLVVVQDVGAVSDKWQFQITPYLWFPRVDADATVSGQTAVTKGDSFDSANLGGSVHFEAWTATVGFIFDLMQLELGPEGTLLAPGQTVHVNADIRQSILEFALSSRHGNVQSAFPGSRIPGQWFDLMTGYRLVDLEQELSLQPGGTLSGNENWSEVFIGARIGFRPVERWTLSVKGDFGAPRLGSTARLIWNGNAQIDYEMTQDISIGFGYRIRDIDYENHGVFSWSALDSRLMGPWLGMTFHF
jgi:hypothetical protein